MVLPLPAEDLSSKPCWRGTFVTSTHVLIFAEKTLALLRAPDFSLRVMRSNIFLDQES